MDNYSLVKQSLADVELGSTGVVLRKAAQAFAFAELCEQGQMLPKGVTKQGAVLSIMAGSRLGMDPFQAVQSVAIINGRPSIWGDTLVAIVKASGLVEDEKIEWFTNENKERIAVRYTVKRKGVATPYVGEFSQLMAVKAGLWGKQGPWTQYPHRMLLARARAFALRDGFADVLKGIRSAEEERDIAATGVRDAEYEDVNVDSPEQDTPVPEPKTVRRKRKAAAEVLKDAEAVSTDADPVAAAPDTNDAEAANEVADANPPEAAKPDKAEDAELLV